MAVQIAACIWQVGSSATLGTSTVFAGNILADQSITLNTTADILCGRAIALNAAVTMDTNTISNDNMPTTSAPAAPTSAATASPPPAAMLFSFPSQGPLRCLAWASCSA